MNPPFELIPAIDLKGGKCVRLKQGRAGSATEYSDDPVAMALHWQSQGATRLHLVDLDGAFSGTPVHLEIARAIFRSLDIPVQFGGGVRSAEQIRDLLAMGAARVILGTVAFEHPEIVEEAIEIHGSEAIVVGIDAREGRVAVRGWVDQSEVRAVDLGRRMGGHGVSRIVYTDVSRDGMLRGANVVETERMARETGLKIIASGGVAGLEDVRRLFELRTKGLEGVILGRALYEGRLAFGEARKVVRSGRMS